MPSSYRFGEDPAGSAPLMKAETSARNFFRDGISVYI
jgi:hypothetical protein